MGLYRDRGIVLRTYKLGEADRIVVVLTEEHGKVRAVAKGARKTRSRLGARLEPVSHAALLLYQGRGELETVSQAELIDGFASIRGDLDRLTRAAAILEASDLAAHEHEPDPRRYHMLLGALRSLAAHPAPLLVPAYFWKLLAHEGVRPELDVCVSCGAAEPLVAFDAGQGGVTCRACRSGVGVTAEGLAMVRRILGGGLVAALDEPASAVTHEVEVLATKAMEHHLERRLRSISLLDAV